MSDISIANLAVQKLGAARILSIDPPDDNSKSAKAIAACFTHERDLELRSHPWSFAKKRIVLAPSAVMPAYGFQYAFPLPSDFLRLLLPAQTNLDWVVESHDGSPAILTNFGTTLNLSYIARIEDSTKFDPCFEESLACRIAWQCCESITQSNSKQVSIKQDYIQAIREARRTNAMGTIPAQPDTDEWLLARL